MSTKTLIMYARSYPCPYVSTAKRVLSETNIPYIEIHIDKDKEAKQRVIAWTGFESVPTLLVAEGESLLPIAEPAPLPNGHSPRGIDRGDMITEPSATELKNWLQKHGLLQEDFA